MTRVGLGKAGAFETAVGCCPCVAVVSRAVVGSAGAPDVNSDNALQFDCQFNYSSKDPMDWEHTGWSNQWQGLFEVNWD